MYTLVRKNKIHSTQAESSTSERFTDYEKALKAFYQYLSNNVADESVEQFDVTILDSDLIPCKTEHFKRKYESAEM